jgi:dipeptidyl aminopeptidase/acylaminoacyl peptidase
VVPLQRLRSLFVACLLLLPGQAQASTSPTGKVAYIGQNQLWVHDLATGARRSLIEYGDLASPRWAPSGRYLSVRSGPQYLVWTADGRQMGVLQNAATDPTWAPDSDRLAYWVTDGKLQVASPTGTILHTIPGPKEHHWPPLWSPDGQRLAWTEGSDGRESKVMRARATDGKPQQLYSLPSGGLHACLYLAAWPNPDAILLWPQQFCSASIAADDSPLARLDVGTGQLRLLSTELAGTYRPLSVLQHPPAIGPGGRAAAVEGIGRISTIGKRIVIIEPDGRVTPPVSPAGQAAIEPAWAPDGKRLAWSGAPDPGRHADWRSTLPKRRIWVADVDGGEPKPVTADPAYRDEAPIWTADGRHLLFARLDKDEKASLWLLDLNDKRPTKLADLDMRPPDDYYGWRQWDRYVAYSPR